MKSKIKKTLYFTQTQLEMGSVKASMMGMSFNDWIKYLVSKELEDFYKVDVDGKKLDAEDKLEYYQGEEYLKSIEKRKSEKTSITAIANNIEDDFIDPMDLPY